MPFLQLTVDIGAADPAPYEDAAFDAGALSVTLEDAADDPILEPAPGATPLWPTVRLKALFDACADSHIIATALIAGLGVAASALRFEEIADRAWEREWLKDFRPMQFGRRLWVCPTGMRPAQADAVIVDLDPGLAFGTGTHPTTALCLEWLDAHPPVGRTILDYGCGSGILAIAALKLGAAHATGFDIDPQALLASRDNALRNEVSDRLNLPDRAGSLQPADVVLANILAGPLMTLAPALASLVHPGGAICLSGLLQEQSIALANRYATWFDMDPAVIRDGWVRLSGTRRPPSPG